MAQFYDWGKKKQSFIYQEKGMFDILWVAQYPCFVCVLTESWVALPCLILSGLRVSLPEVSEIGYIQQKSRNGLAVSVRPTCDNIEV